MKFRTKLIMGFSCVVFVISVLMGIAYFQYNTNRLQEKERQNIRFYSEQLSDTVDTALNSMKQVTDYILSDPDLLTAIQTIPVYRETGKELERLEQLDILSAGITLDYINRNFYRVVIFNEMGDVASSTSVGQQMTNKNRDAGEIPWLEDAAGKYGKPLVIPPHRDGWGLRENPEVFSLVRKVQGGNFGYIEVQDRADTLEGLFALPDPEAEVAAWLPDGRLLYQRGELDKEAFIAGFDKTGEAPESLEGEKLLASLTESEGFGVRVAVMKSGQGIFGDVKEFLFLALALMAGCFVTCMLLVVLIANRLAKPITSLRKQMEQTELENLDEQTVLPAGDDEVEALGAAYQNLTRRLNESIVKERRASLLQLQAQFDTLQAQVNPHFLYNVLNTISNRGVVNEDDVICEICGSLAAMLRYSSSNKERYATVEQELEYVEKYVYLLKSRYEHRLEVEISCSDDIKNEMLPKIVIQQLVENSIQHGYANGLSVMRIYITGWSDGSAWYIRVRDNGQGITPEIKADIEKKIEKIKEKILRKHTSVEMEIGGMGLANTYARMFLLYADRVVFRMENTGDGFCITIGVEKNPGGGYKHVSGNGSGRRAHGSESYKNSNREKM